MNLPLLVTTSLIYAAIGFGILTAADLFGLLIEFLEKGDIRYATKTFLKSAAWTIMFLVAAMLSATFLMPAS